MLELYRCSRRKRAIIFTTTAGLLSTKKKMFLVTLSDKVPIVPTISCLCWELSPCLRIHRFGTVSTNWPRKRAGHRQSWRGKLASIQRHLTRAKGIPTRTSQDGQARKAWPRYWMRPIHRLNILSALCPIKPSVRRSISRRGCDAFLSRMLLRAQASIMPAFRFTPTVTRSTFRGLLINMLSQSKSAVMIFCRYIGMAT